MLDSRLQNQYSEGTCLCLTLQAAPAFFDANDLQPCSERAKLCSVKLKCPVVL